MKQLVILFISTIGMAVAGHFNGNTTSIPASINHSKEWIRKMDEKNEALGLFEYGLHYFKENETPGKIPKPTNPADIRIGLPNPFIEVTSKKKLEKINGYSAKIPETINSHFIRKKMYYCKQKGTIFSEVIYQSPDGGQLFLRFSKDFSAEELHGNYETINKKTELHAAQLLEFNKSSVLLWQEKGLNYCLIFETKINETTAKTILKMFVN